MRKLLLLWCVLILQVSAYAVDNTNVTVHLDQPGTLLDVLGDQGFAPREVTRIKVTGTIDEEDFRAMSKIMIALEYIDISGTDITSIPASAFDGKSILKECLVPAGIKSIGQYAFRNCSNLTNIPFGDAITSIGYAAFQSCGQMIGDLSFPVGFSDLGSYAFQSTNIISVKFSAGYVSLGDYAFQYCSNLKRVDMSLCEVSQISSQLFFDCNSLKNVQLPLKGSNMEMMGSSSYTINNYAFYNTGIEEITLPSSISTIHSEAFHYCNQLRTINALGITPINAYENAFNNVDKTLCIVNVPAGAAKNYYYANEWSTFSYIEEMGIKAVIGNNGVLYQDGKKVENESVVFNYSKGVDFTVVPSPGYEIDEVIFQKAAVAHSNNTFTIGEGDKTGTLQVTFKLKQFDLAISTLGNGQLKVDETLLDAQTTLKVDSGAVVRFTLQSEAGFGVSSIKYNNQTCVAQQDGSIFVTPFAQTNATMEVVFESQSAIGNMHTIDITVGDNGSVVYQNTPMLAGTNVSVKEGDEPAFTITPAKYYKIARVMYGGVNVTKEVVDGVFTASAVGGGAQLEVTFELDPIVTVELDFAGSLNTVLSEEQLGLITHLTILGEMNSADFVTMNQSMPELSVIDLSNATVQGGAIPYAAFCRNTDSSNFIGKETLSEIRLPKNVTIIQDYAFAGCANLTKVNFEECTALQEIYSYAFSSTGLRDIDLSNTKITSLNSGEFRNNKTLRSIQFPATLKSLDTQFQESALVEVDLSHTKLENLTSWMFSSCTKLEKVLLPSSLTSIKSNAFHNTSIVAIDMSHTSVSSIADRAFSSCSKLEKVLFPASLTSIKEYAFESCGLTELDLSVTSRLTLIPEFAFYYCNKLKEVKLPANITTIERYAFDGSPIETINLAECNKLRTIGEYAFNSAKINGIVELPASLQSIGDVAFSSNNMIYKLNSLTPPTIGSNPFGNVSEGGVVLVMVPLESVDVYRLTDGWSEFNILSGEAKVEVTITTPGNLAADILTQTGLSPANITHLKIAGGAMNHVDFSVLRSNMTALYDLDLSAANVETIPTNALLNKKSLINLVLPQSLVTIDENAFNGCSALSGTLVLPEGVKTIGNSAFKSCSSLEKVVFSKELITIGDEAFRDCSSLKQELQFSDKLESIGAYAFYNCSQLFGKIVFPASFKQFKDSYIENYRRSGAFYYCSNIEEVDFSACDELLELPRDVFRNCNKLKSVVLPSKLTTIGQYGFYNCSSLEEINFPSTLRNINEYAFQSCSKLKAADLYNCNQLTSISRYTFDACSALATVHLPESVNTIGEYAFRECRALTSLNVYNRIPAAVETNAFQRVNTNVCVLSIPTGSVNDYFVANGWLTFANIQEMGIKVLVGDNGVLYNGETKVASDEVVFHFAKSANFNTVPVPGYEIDEVIFQNEAVAHNDNAFSVGEGIKSGIMKVSFKLKQFDLAISTVGNGQLKIDEALLEAQTTLKVDSGAVVRFTLQAEEGYGLSSIKYNDQVCVAQQDGTIFVAPFAQANATMEVVFDSQSAIGNTHVIDITVGDNGSVVYQNTPMLAATNITVKEGDEPSFIITPAKYYKIARVMYGGEDVTKQVVDGVFTASAVGGAAQLDVTFELDSAVTVVLEFAGTLNTVLSADQLGLITHLTLKGEINSADFTTMNQSMPELMVIDMYEANVENGYIPYAAFCTNTDYSNPVGKETLAEIRLPKNIRGINNNAFAGCGNLMKVNFDECTELYDISSYAFSSTGLRDLDLYNTKITSLNYNQFRKNKSLRSIQFPATLQSLDNQFSESSLMEIDLSHTQLTTLGSNAFSECKNLEKVLLPASLSSIESHAFYNSGVKELDLSHTEMTSINNYAFYYARELTKVLLPSTIQKIGERAFHYTAIESIDLSQFNKLTSIASYAFGNCYKLNEVTLPTSITTIENYAFSIAPITKINLSDCSKLRTIGEYAFSSLRVPGILELPGSLTSMGSYAFPGNNTVCRIAAKTPPTITASTFGGNMSGEGGSTGMIAVFVPEGSMSAYKNAPYWDEYTILDRENKLEVNVTQPGNLAIDIMEQGGVSPALVTHLTIASGKMNNVDFAVLRSNMSVLYDLDMSGAEVDMIPTNALLDKKILMRLVLPSSVVMIEEGAFKGCSSIAGNLVMPETLSTIGNSAFDGCTSLQHIAFSTSLTKIGANAFNNCRSLKQEITFPERLEVIGGGAFSGCSELFGTLTFPASLKAIEKSYIDYSYRGSNFSNCTNLEVVDLSACINLTTIADYAFSNCSSLTTVMLPDSLQTIEEYTFSSCGLLSDINFPTSLTSINNYAFNSCKSLQVVDLSKSTSLTNIGSSAFDYCSALTTVNIPESVNYIGSYAFRECRALTNLTVAGKTPAQLGDYAFRRVNTDVCALTIPTSAFYDYLTAAQWGAFVQMRKAIEIVLDEGAEMTYVNNASLDEEVTTTRMASPMARNNEPAKGDAIVKDGSSVYVKENETVSFFITPDENVAIKQVLYNDEDVTALMVNNTFTTPQVDEKSTLRVMLETTGDIFVSSIEMSKTELILKEAESAQLFATVLPHNATNKGVIWRSDNESVATVDRTGNVKGIAPGTATITATSEEGGKVGACTVKVLSNNYFFRTEDVKGYINTSVSIPVSMINEDEVVAFQCDIYLPEGVVLNNYEGSCIDMDYSRNNGHVVTSARQLDNSYRVLVYSQVNNPFFGNDGKLFSIPVRVVGDAGSYTVQLKNIRVTGENAIDFILPNITSRILIDDYRLGDSNGDGDVSISDVTNTTNYILGNYVYNFIFDAADVNQDQEISVGDVAGTVAIILNENTEEAPYAAAYTRAQQLSEEITINDVDIAFGETKVIDVVLDNATSYSALQGDIFLPEGMELVGVNMDVDLFGSNHVTAYATRANGSTRVVCYSANNSNFVNFDNVVLQLTVKATDELNTTDAMVEVKNLRVTTAESEEHSVKDAYAYVTIVPTSIIDTQFDDMKVYTDGHDLCIDSNVDVVLQLVSLDGKTTPLVVKQGTNRFYIEQSGVYIVNKQKVVIQ